MLTFENFTGINNVQPSHRLDASALTEATNVDIGLTGEIKRRAGYSETLDTCHKNLWQADGFMLATVNGGDLIKMEPDGTGRVTLYPSLGASRVWYCNLPDGRTAFSNGLICGVVSASTATTWGVQVPESVGDAMDISGDLDPGDYIYEVAYVRTSDGLEGDAESSEPVTLADGGLMLTGLPVLAGHTINVYLSGANGEGAYLAGNTANSLFSFTGKNSALISPKRTGDRHPAPAGKYPAVWRSRVLLAVGSVLYASLPGAWESFDLQRDFKQFSAPITMVQPVAGGVFVGTEHELAFLSGTEFDKLVYTRVLDGAVVPGSGVEVQGEHIQRGDGTGQGRCMVCIAGGGLVAGFGDGGIALMTKGRYATEVTEVAATFRLVNGIPQYIAVPQ